MIVTVMITVDYCIDTLDDMSLALIWLNIWMSTCYFLFHVNILFGKLKFYFQLPDVSTLIMPNRNWKIVLKDRKSCRLVGRIKVETSVTGSSNLILNGIVWVQSGMESKFRSVYKYMHNNNFNKVKYFFYDILF